MNSIYKIQNTEFSVDTNFKNSFEVKSHPNNYNVYFDSYESVIASSYVLLIDSNVKKIYNINHPRVIEIDATEHNKSIETVLSICDKLLKFNFNKQHSLAVVGGGILQDLAAFACKMYKRGVDWQYVPTTLLSQCDSCIGGKTALNFQTYKNQLALFSAPTNVFIDTKFIDTLSSTDVVSGMGEIIKMFFIGGSNFLDKLSCNNKELIYYSLLIKKQIIEYDEFENCHRKALNLGHTFGHIIEPLTNFSISHGEAVLLGIEIINKLYYNNSEISSCINKYTSLEKIKNINVNKLFNSIKTDKKVHGNTICFVGIKNIGNIEFIEKNINEELKNKLYEVFVN